MPFCETCAKYWAPSAATTDGTCPTCGRALDKPRSITRPAPAGSGTEGGPGESGTDGKKLKVPWHFTVLVTALAVYLAFRLYQFVVWMRTGVWQ